MSSFRAKINVPCIHQMALFLTCVLSLFSATAIAADASALSTLPVTDRIKSCNPSIAIPAAQEILNNPESLKEPLSLFSPVQTLYQHGQKDEAVFWYYAAQLRARYQFAFEKGDRAQLLMVINMTTGQLINNYALQDTNRFNKTLDRVLEWDKKTGNPYRDRPQNETTKNEIAKIYDSFNDIKMKLVSEKDKLETQSRKNAPQLQTFADTFKAQCESGLIDPAFAGQETKKEWEHAIQFAKDNPEVIRAVGKVKDAFPVASTRNGNKGSMPNRYEVSARGENGKPVYALIDVTRNAGQAIFALACTTSIPLGNREAGKNACEQQAYEATARERTRNATSTYHFAGTSWRSPAAYSDTAEFRETGTVAFKTPRGYSYGQWKVEDGVLYFDNNNYSHYEATIDGDWLLVKGSNAVNNWSTKWYRTDNEKLDKEIKKDIEDSIKDFNNTIEAKRLTVMGESEETEKMLQAGKGEQYGGKHWLSLCEEPDVRIKAMSMASLAGKSQSELCYNWYGTRHDWKENILKEGCRGRCRP